MENTENVLDQLDKCCAVSMTAEDHVISSDSEKSLYDLLSIIALLTPNKDHTTKMERLFYRWKK
jgi:hypothetical protein